MIIKITTLDNKTPLQGVKRILEKYVLLYLLNDATKDILKSLYMTVCEHINKSHVNHKHCTNGNFYNPNKVSLDNVTKTTASINIDIPGICRAYHNHNIKPKNARHLTIPMHLSAYGKSAKDFSDLIYIKKKNDKEFLALKQNNGLLTFLYFLTTHVHQIQDKRLMPTDETLAENSFLRIYSKINK